ncbi:hypothetical protein ACHAWO_010002 [Cyclotella atomus]|uniref:Uncharacterized protein n=1 Tax=Cyclotella atomus TaxID=382360 RepID=A0ABD3MNF9_9STRA
MVRSLLLVALAAAGSNGFSSTPHLGHPSAKPSIRPAMRLQYAALEDPMSKADSTKSGCPFLIQKYEFRTFDVPALFGADSRPIILFDKNCPISSRLLSKVLKYGNIRYAPLQSTVGDLLLMRMSDEVRDEVVGKTATVIDKEDVYKSIVVCDASRTYVKSSAMLEIMRILTRASADDDTSEIKVKPSKRFKLMQYLALISYIVPNRLRDRIYDSVTKRKRWFGTSTSIDIQDDRFVKDASLTGGEQPTTNLFQSDNPPTRGSRVKIVHPQSSSPSITYDEEFPNGLCLVGGIGTISTVDLPMRIVMRVERDSLGVKSGDEGIIAWVKPEEVAML